MPTEGPLTESGLEVWPRGIYDLVTRISKEYNHPIIEITESGCGYLDAPYDKENGRIPDWPDPEKVDELKVEFCPINRSRTNEKKSIQ
jgi:beta-glucosidase/6-phospho-beta-glucosidase/beta-galactosidase